MQTEYKPWHSSYIESYFTQQAMLQEAWKLAYMRRISSVQVHS